MRKAIRKPLLSSIICVFTIIFILTSISVINVFADSQSEYVAEVNSVKYKNYAEAWSAVSSGGTITMLGDWTTSAALAVNSNTTVTVNMNGFMINRALSSSKSDGEVFWVKSGAVLNIIGDEKSQTVHKGTIQADMWHYNANGNYTITGALITGGYSSNGGGAIHIKDGAQVNITNVTIAGNASSDGQGGGAIKLDSDKAKLTVTDSEICYNKTTGYGGAAIEVHKSNDSVNLYGVKINNNIATNGYNGGAIQINNGTVTIAPSSKRVSEISFNTAGKNGGAIYVSNGNLILDPTTIFARNNAGKEGGAIYVDSGADNVEIKGVFTGNYAAEEGGAIYVNSNVSGNNGAKISDAEFLGNRAVLHGGAIYVDSDDEITLSGKVIANGNTPNSLYVQSASAIASNNLTEGSKIGLMTKTDLNTTNYQYFFSDLVGYKVGNTKESVFLVKAEAESSETITVGNYTYPVNKGSFVYDAVEGGQMTAYYYYSDGYFAESARYYNEHLVTMSSCVAISGVTARFEGEYTPEKASENIVELFESAGFTNIYIHYPEPEFFGKDAETLSTIGYVIASREINVNGETVTLIAVGLRGGSYGAEWASNVSLGSGVGEALGFSDAANQVEEGIYNYIRDYGINDYESKFWISGFSRGGATTNLVAKRLTDVYGEDDVYAFCFEAPKGGVYSELKDGLTYCNIHAIINATDIVPYVGPAEMGFIRYGVDHMLPSYQVGTSEYEQQKKLMLDQLAAINPNIAFNDKFSEATISYLGNTIFGWAGWDMISEFNGDYDTAGQWNPVFMKKLQEYSLTNNVEGSIYNKNSTNWYGYRYYWSTYRWYLYEETIEEVKDGVTTTRKELYIKCYETAPDDIDSGKYTVLTIEDAIATIMNFYYGTDDAKKDKIVEAIDINVIMSNISTTDIYWDIIGVWNGMSVKDKNKQFNKLWDATKIESQVASVLTPEETKTLKTSFYVLLDFLLDFVGDDYDSSNQNMIGTIVHNISNLFQPHYYSVVCAWARSYDSFYATGDLVSPPMPPKVNLQSGTYTTSIKVEFTADNSTTKIYYTLDGTTPNLATGNYTLYEGAIHLSLTDGKYRAVTIKAIAVTANGYTSELVTYNYVLTTNAQIVLENQVVRVYNFTGTAYLVLASYDGDVLNDVQYFQVTSGNYIDLNSISLKTDRCIIAYLVRDFEDFNLLGHPVELTNALDSVTQRENIRVNTETNVVIKSFEAFDSEDLKYVTINFTTEGTTAEQLIVALFEKNTKYDFDNVLYFNMISKNKNNTYTFNIDRSLLQEVMGTTSVSDVDFVLMVSGNGTSESDTAELLFNESVYTITYHIYGGVNDSRNPDYFTKRTEDFFVHPATREHYYFVAWYTNSDFRGDPVWAIDASETGDIHLYAKWEVLSYVVIYEDGANREAFGYKSFEVPYNSKTPEFGADPVREGYTFIGWDKEISKTVEGDTVYIAVWKQNHVHTPVLNSGIEASCSIPGYKSYYECADCGYFEDEDCTVNIIDIELWKETTGKTTAEHEFAKKIQDKDHLVIGTGSNCMDAVRFYYGCNDCDVIGTVEWISDLYGDHTIDNNLTSADDQHYHVCLNEGCNYTTEKMYCSGGVATCTDKAICTVCENAYGELLAHNYEFVVTSPTCTTSGYTTYKCTLCDDTYVADEVKELGHTEVIDSLAYPTCTLTGLTEGKHCLVCGTVLVEQEVVPANGHAAGESVAENNTAADCVNSGSYDSVVYCTVCDIEISRTVIEIPAIGHAEVIDVAVAPTCTLSGLTEGKHCSVCNEIIVAQETVAAIGHSYNSVVTEPKCEAGGYTTHTCSNCSDTYVDAYTDALGHDWVDATLESPKTCKVCGRTEGDKLVPSEETSAGMLEMLENWIIGVYNAIINFFRQIIDFFKNLFK